jgi:hypothetical protein
MNGIEERLVSGYMEAIGVQIGSPSVKLLDKIAYMHPIVFHY